MTPHHSASADQTAVRTVGDGVRSWGATDGTHRNIGSRVKTSITVLIGYFFDGAPAMVQLIQKGVTEAVRIPIPESASEIWSNLNGKSKWSSGFTTLEFLERMDAGFEEKKRAGRYDVRETR